MASNVLCGRCGSLLDHPSAACRSCGAQSSGVGWARPRKSPAVAAALAIVPGLGHLYLGEYVRAAGVMIGAGMLEFVGFDLDLTLIGAMIGVPMELGGFGLWMFSIVDAYRTAQRPRQ